MGKLESTRIPVFEADAPGYGTDFCAWSAEQGRRLRLLRIPGLDTENLAEEIEGLGRSDRRELRSRIETLLVHLLKWQYQPDLAGRSWRSTLSVQRKHIRKLLEESPSLRPAIAQLIEDGYPDAVEQAMIETGLLPDMFPAGCEWTEAESLLRTSFPRRASRPHRFRRDGWPERPAPLLEPLAVTVLGCRMGQVDTVQVPVFEAESPGYEADFYAWSMEQSARLRLLRIPGLDIENLAEEIESLGRSVRRELRSRVVVLLVHLLKWRYQPDLAGRSWRSTLLVQRHEIQALLEENPSQRPVIASFVATGYPRAIGQAVLETRLLPDMFPPACEWTEEEILDPDFLPPPG